MKKKPQVLATEDDLFVNLTFHRIPASLLTEFAEKIVRPYYADNMNVAIQDLLHKALAEHDLVLSHITHTSEIARKHDKCARHPSNCVFEI